MSIVTRSVSEDRLGLVYDHVRASLTLRVTIA